MMPALKVIYVQVEPNGVLTHPNLFSQSRNPWPGTLIVASVHQVAEFLFDSTCMQITLASPQANNAGVRLPELAANLGANPSYATLCQY